MPDDTEYGLVAVPRRLVPDRLLAWISDTFGNEFATKQPWRWILYRELDEFTRRRMRKPGQTL